MPGINGTYYPVQVRALLRDGKLGYPDFPFIFYLEAAVARLLLLFKVGGFSDCIMLASKIVDAVFPTLAAIPVFLLARDWSLKGEQRPWVPPLAAAFSVLFLSPLVLVADFQKNAAGFVWFFLFVYLLYHALDEGSWIAYVGAGVALALTGLTHLGCLGLAIIFLFASVGAFLTAMLPGITTGRKERLPARFNWLVVLVGIGVLVSLLAITAACLYFFFDPVRIRRLISIFLSPLAIFSNPVIFNLISGQSILGNRPDWVIIISIAILGSTLLVREWSSLSESRKSLVASSIVCSLFLAAPIFNEHWADRLWFMAYAPAVVVITFLLIETRHRVTHAAMAALASLGVVASVVMMVGMERSAAITEEAYAELEEIRNVIDNPRSAFVAARHGLEWWAAWVLGTDAGQESGLSRDSWERYNQIFFLRQDAGARGYGPGGPGAPPFPEVRIPEDAEIVFDGDYFTLALLPDALEWGPPDESAIVTLFKHVEHQLREGNPVVEVTDPHLQLPSDVYQAQVNKYFRLGDVYFALVLQESRNVTLNLSDGVSVSFVGILAGIEGGSWEKFLEIKDKDESLKSNPYYLWSDGEKIFLSVVDQRGENIGEGEMRLAASYLGWYWAVERCYYFGANYDSTRDGDYYEFSKRLDRQQAQPTGTCDGLILTPGHL